jgi:hypothetical protein
MGHHLLRHRADMAPGDAVEARAQLAVTFGPWAVFPYSGEGTIVGRERCLVPAAATCGVRARRSACCLAQPSIRVIPNRKV